MPGDLDDASRAWNCQLAGNPKRSTVPGRDFSAFERDQLRRDREPSQGEQVGARNAQGVWPGLAVPGLGSLFQSETWRWSPGQTPLNTIDLTGRTLLVSSRASVRPLPSKEKKSSLLWFSGSWDEHPDNMMAELDGEPIDRSNLSSAMQKIGGALVMGSCGIYDAMTRNLIVLVARSS